MIDTNAGVYLSGLPAIVLGFGSEGDYTNSPTLCEVHLVHRIHQICHSQSV
jgi:hypothetical protein